MDVDDYRKGSDAQFACSLWILFAGTVCMVVFVACLLWIRQPGSATSENVPAATDNGAPLSLLPMPGNPFVPGM